MNGVKVASVRSEDFAWILELIDANSAEALTPAERAERGFVQGQWNDEQLARLLDNPGMYCARVNGTPAGVLVTSRAGAVTKGPAG